MGKPGSGYIISLSDPPNIKHDINITGFPPGVIKIFSGLINVS